MNTFRTFLFQNLEAIIWLSVLVYFALSPVHATGHFTICPLNLAGFKYCPGCGLGRSMILFMHGHFKESLHMHPLAPLAVGVLTMRIGIIFRNNYKAKKQFNSNPIQHNN